MKTRAEQFSDIWKTQYVPALAGLGPFGRNEDIEGIASFVYTYGPVDAFHLISDAAIHLAVVICDLHAGKNADLTFAKDELYPVNEHAMRLVLSFMDGEMEAEALAESLGDGLDNHGLRAVLLQQLSFSAYSAIYQAWELAEAD